MPHKLTQVRRDYGSEGWGFESLRARFRFALARVHLRR